MQKESSHRAPKKMERTRYPSIYKRGSRYVIVWEHRGTQHKKAYRTLAEAREAQGLRRQHGERKPASRQQFEDYAMRWLDTYKGRRKHGIGATTRADYRRAMKQHAIPHFAGRKLADIEAPDLRDFVTALESKGLAPASIKKALAPVKAMFATAVEDHSLRINPAAGLVVTGRADDEEADPEVKAMTRVQLARVLNELPEDWRLFFELLAHTGLRISEALGLDWADVEFGKRPRLRVRRQYYRGTLTRLKTRNSRRDLPLTQALAQRLWAARPASAEGPMFTTSNGTRYLDRNVRRVLDRASEPAGVEWIGFHTFRHTCASLLFEGGKNIAVVSKWLGHADPAFTMRTYVHLLDDGLGDAEFMDAAVSAAHAEHDGEADATAPVATTATG